MNYKIKKDMIKNVNFKLIGKKQKWYWIDTAIVDDNILIRLFRALSKATTYEEQENLMSKVELNEGRNPKAENTLQYNYGKNYVEIQLCHYIPEQDNYVRGKKIDVIQID